MKKAVPLLLALVGWSLTTAATAADTAADWLAKISDAARTANYRGVIIYQSQERMETMRVVHRYKSGQEVERVQALTGPPREILKQGNQVICLLPKDRKVALELPTPKGLFPGLTPERVTQISAYYRFDDLGETRIAGRNCRGISISPRDQFRYGYEIWADTATAVPVKVNLVGRGNTVMEQLMFTEIEFPSSIPDSALQTELDPKLYAKVTRKVVEPSPVDTDASDLQLVNLPPGYRVTMRDIRPTADGQGVVEHLLLSDGLSAISVFSAHRKVPARMFQGASQIGALNAYGRVVGGVHVTVVGEAPSETVRQIGDNLQPSGVLPLPPADPQPVPPER